MDISNLPSTSATEQYISIVRVEKDDKVGYVNGWGEEILPVEFDEGSFHFYENRITVRKGENWYIYDVQGNLLLNLEDRYKFVGISGDDLFFVSNKLTREKSNYYYFYRFDDLDELRFIDLSGEEKVVVRHGLDLSQDFPTYLWLSDSRFVDGAAIVDSTIIPNDPTNKSTLSNTFLINHRGERVFPRDVHIMRNTTIEDSTVIVEKYFGEQLKFALAKTDGTFLTDFTFDFIHTFYGRGYYSAEVGNTHLYLDKNGKPVHAELTSSEGRDDLPFSSFSRPSHYTDGLAFLYYEDKRIDVIDMESHVILSFSDRSLGIEGGIIKVWPVAPSPPEGPMFQYYDRKGRLLEFKEYDKVFEFRYLRL